MRHVPIAEFKDHLSELVAAVERGEEVVITRHGKPAVRLVPAEESMEERRRHARQALERMAEQREWLAVQGYRATAEDWIAWKNEGRR